MPSCIMETLSGYTPERMRDLVVAENREGSQILRIVQNGDGPVFAVGIGTLEGKLPEDGIPGEGAWGVLGTLTDTDGGLKIEPYEPEALPIGGAKQEKILSEEEIIVKKTQEQRLKEAEAVLRAKGVSKAKFLEEDQSEYTISVDDKGEKTLKYITYIHPRLII